MRKWSHCTVKDGVMCLRFPRDKDDDEKVFCVCVLSVKYIIKNVLCAVV